MVITHVVKPYVACFLPAGEQSPLNLSDFVQEVLWKESPRCCASKREQQLEFRFERHAAMCDIVGQMLDADDPFVMIYGPEGDGAGAPRIRAPYIVEKSDARTYVVLCTKGRIDEDMFE